MEGHAKTCVEQHCGLANEKQSSNCTRCPPHVLTTMSSKKRKSWKRWENGQKVCSQIVLECLYLARIGRPDILWSVNKLTRAVTTWTRSCDRRLARLTLHVHNTNDHRQYGHARNTAQHCRLGLFQDSDFAGEVEDSKSTSGRTLRPKRITKHNSGFG